MEVTKTPIILHRVARVAGSNPCRPLQEVQVTGVVQGLILQPSGDKPFGPRQKLGVVRRQGKFPGLLVEVAAPPEVPEGR
jgi:hypothetical protein